VTRRISTAIGAISLFICNYSSATPPGYGDGACLDASICVSVDAKDVKNVGVQVLGSTNVDQLVGAIKSTLPTADTIVVKNAGNIDQTSVSALSAGTEETDIGLIRPSGAFDKIIINLSGGDVTNTFIGMGGVNAKIDIGDLSGRNSNLDITARSILNSNVSISAGSLISIGVGDGTIDGQISVGRVKNYATANVGGGADIKVGTVTGGGRHNFNIKTGNITNHSSAGIAAKGEILVGNMTNVSSSNVTISTGNLASTMAASADYKGGIYIGNCKAQGTCKVNISHGNVTAHAYGCAKDIGCLSDLAASSCIAIGNVNADPCTSIISDIKNEAEKLYEEAKKLYDEGKHEVEKGWDWAKSLF
jgi:hypothetical protein